MKINKKAKKHALTIWLPVAGVALIAIGGLLLWQHTSNSKKTNSNTTSTINLEPPTTEQKQAAEEIKTSTATTTTNSSTVTKNPTVSTTMSISISATNVTSDLVQIRAIIVGATSDSGSCTLVLTNGESTITKASSTYRLPSSSTCQGFDINRSELSNGEWNINLTATIGTETAVTSGKITLE